MVSYRKYTTDHSLLWVDGAGNVYADNSGTENIQCPTDKGKTSVDSGSFTPGVYRVNPYTVYREELDIDDAEISLDYKPYPHIFGTMKASGPLAAHLFQGVGSTSIPTIAATLRQHALQKAHAKLGAADLALGEDLGEIRETLQMLKDPLSALRKYLSEGGIPNLKKIKNLLKYQKTGRYLGKSGKKAAKTAADTWLEVRYGFRPLMLLLGDLVEQANATMYDVWDPNKIRSVRARIEGTVDETRSTGNIGGIMDATNKYEYVNIDELVAHASVQYTQTIDMSGLMKLGLSPRFWPETFWELTRLSFVWDWFISIGPWLNGLRFTPEITVLGNTTGISLKRTTKGTLVGVYLNGLGNPVTPISASGTRQLQLYKRYVGTEVPLTPLIRLDQALDLNKLVDLLSLTFQRIFR